MNVLLTVFLVALVIPVVLNLFVFLFQDRLIFRADRLDSNFKFSFEEPYEEIFLNPEPNVVLHNVLFRSARPQGLILYFHGNRADMRRWGSIASSLTKYNYDVLIPDYRGYGKSLGVRTEMKLYQDALYTYEYVNEVFDYKRVIFYGRSLGSAMAVDLATRVCPNQLILETPFSQISDVLRKFKWIIHPGILSRYKFPSINKVEKITCPVTIFHGTKDFVVPIRFAEQLIEKISINRKKIIRINKGGHNNLNNFEFYHYSLKIILSNEVE